MNGENLHPWIDPELEARVVALVLGEASDFEREELDRLIAEKPELAALKKRFEATHGLLRETAEGEAAADDEEWKLSPERRAKVLEVIGGAPAAGGKAGGVTVMGEGVRGERVSGWAVFAKVAAVVCLLGAAAGVLFVAYTGGRMPMVGSVDRARSERVKDSSSWFEAKPAAESAVEVVGALEQTAPTGPPADYVITGDALRSNEGAAVDAWAWGRDSDVEGKEVRDSLAVLDGALRIPAEASDEKMRFGEKSSVAGEGEVGFEKRYAFSDSERRREGAPAKRAAEKSDIAMPAVVEEGFSGGGAGVARRGIAAAGLEADANEPVSSFGLEAESADVGVEASAIAGARVVTKGKKSELSARQVTEEAEVEESEAGAKDLALGKVSIMGRRFDDARKGVPSSAPAPAPAPAPAQAPKPEPPATLPELGARPTLALKPKPAPGKQVDYFFREPAETKKEVELGEVPARKTLREIEAAKEAFSTFSLHVSDVSFKLAEAALAKGEWPEAGTVRIEEFVNALDYGDPMPSQSDKVACVVEQAAHPFLQQRNVLRIGMRTAAAGRAGDTPLRLTILLDNSGSMERLDREETVERAFALLADQLQPMDQVTLISFARQPRLLADRVGGEEKARLRELATNAPSEGGTNVEAALKLAFEKAKEQRKDNAQNRIVLLTDGAANLGDAEPERLRLMIEEMRDAGIAFDAAGIGAEGLNDEILEALTRKGDGRYYLLERPEDADEGFARQIAGALRPAAKNVKVQVEFNPKRVGKYKLLGFEKHRLAKEDFRDDSVDAAEMAAEEAGVAVYQFEPIAEGEGDVGSVSVRFRDMSTGEMVEKRWPIPYEADAPRVAEAVASLRMATAAAMLAAKLGEDPLGEVVELDELARVLAGLPEPYGKMERVRELREMIGRARSLEGK